MPWTREEKIFCVTTYLETKIIQNCLKIMQPINMIMIYYRDKKLKKRLHVLEADIIIIKENFDLMCLAQRMHFLLAVFQMTTILLVSVVNYYQNNGWHLF